MSRTSLREIVHLVASLLVLTIAFTYPNLIPQALLAAAFGVGTGFLLHELAHKFTAQRYGYAADYEASPMGLMMALGLSLATNGGFVFAAPGAVMIRGKRVYYNPLEDRYRDSHQATKELAYISASGAVVNLVLAILFLIATFFVAPRSFASMVLIRSAFINVFLGVFNMIPFGPLDGAKVWQYNRSLWLMVMIPSILLFILFIA
ncbi:M50 family metallopeptidase [Candidatus Methanoperedens nitratireducens]|uniref:Putative metalloprotease (M50 family) n=1 Tax=Candidatus Methanoperedens nitratireducens TaxID=1392998 RepID=A0A284VKS6_9EURY|nr:M50 family metallopeptidase [Candidatus Methanoperedens nitroreducens]SNQ59833.1 putative metalloprotease (M50 family) [Candidatus Methanoperedens nitroreducens]